MERWYQHWLVGVIIVGLGGGLATAQSLGSLGRKSRPSTAAAPESRTFTNEDLAKAKGTAARPTTGKRSVPQWSTSGSYSPRRRSGTSGNTVVSGGAAASASQAGNAPGFASMEPFGQHKSTVDMQTDRYNRQAAGASYQSTPATPERSPFASNSSYGSFKNTVEAQRERQDAESRRYFETNPRGQKTLKNAADQAARDARRKR